MKRGARRVFLGVQWDVDSWDELPSLGACVIERIGSVPLHWNFPAVPADGSKKTRTWVEKALAPRIAAGTDMATPMGFAGACHPFLNPDELDKELSWCLKNPWGTGLMDIIGVRPSILVPRVPDLGRAEARKLYKDHGFTALGVSRTGAHTWFDLDGLGCFTFVRLFLAASEPAASAGLKVSMRRGADLFLMLDITGAALPRLQETLDAINASLIAPQNGSITLLGAPPSSAQQPGPAPLRVDWSPFPEPLLRRKLSAAAAISRKKRKKTEEYRELLVQMSPAGSGAGVLEGSPAASLGDTRLVAQMLGDVVLAGNVFDVKLTGGRFCGIVHAGRQILPARAAQSYLRVSSRTWRFQTRNSFSFEREAGTGLREELAIDSRDGAELVIEYSFRDDCPMLEIRADIRWPVISPGLRVDEHAPFVMSLAAVTQAEPALIEAVAPDESVTSVRISDGAWLAVPAAEHRVKLPGGGSLILRPSPQETRGWNVMSFRLARDRRARILEANPFGGWAPVAPGALSGKSQSFALLMGLLEESPRQRDRR